MTEPRFEHWAAQPGPRGETQPRIPAATVILLRDAEDGLETLMLKRASKLAFAGGLWVFPGGRVDPLDLDPSNPEDHQLAAARAAVREAQEEADLIVELEGLVPLAYWEPPPQTPKRFSTWFFVARAPEGLVTVDGGEITEHEWAQPARTLERRDLGELELAPPTWVTLRTLAASETVSDALQAASDATIEHFCTHASITEDGGVIAMWHGDAGYESGDTSAPGLRHRLSMYETRWDYERNAPIIEIDRDRLK
ncbi:ADP-ribose pyrophosphatase [Actinobacteria bacterium IMCC26256]|nr:ADP-ribose pyrophosphatase [Actinobacteria bacterium IMCC26256]